MKYFILTLLIAVAILCMPSASTQPQDTALDDLIGIYTRYVIEAINEIPEPYKAKLINQLQGAKNDHWNSFAKYVAHISFLVREALKQITYEDKELTRNINRFLVDVDVDPKKSSLSPNCDKKSREIFDYSD